MKTKVSFISKAMTFAIAIVMTSTAVFADGETTDAYATGTTNTPAGDFVVRATSDVFNFQGEAYEVYKVYYDDPSLNFQIAAKGEGKCKSLIAYTDDYTFFYECNKDGFGVRKVMFSNPEVHKRFNESE